MNSRDQPLITVITPVYNAGELLEECIISVLEQGYEQLEYVIVDGGSIDNTVDIIRRYSDRLAFWVSEPDMGQTDALNKGFRRASGDLVAWLNADDFYYSGALTAAADAYLDDPSAPFYFGSGDRVNRAGRQKSEFFPDGNVHFRRDALLFGLNTVLQPATFIRRAALEEVGFLDPDLQYGFDTDLWLRLSELGYPRPIRKRLAASREYNETKTARGSFERAEELRRIAERHTGVAVTPGSISYYLDTLQRSVAERRDVFPRDYGKAIGNLRRATSDLLTRYGARPDGFPVQGVEQLVDLSSVHDISRLRVGIDMRHVAEGEAGGIVAVLAGTFQQLFARRPDVEFVVFCTVFNHDVLAVDAPNVEIVTLPLDDFFDELGRLARASRIDVLFRSYPSVESVDFPLGRQIFLLPDLQHEFHPEFFDSRTLRARRVAFERALGEAAAIMAISEFAKRTIERRSSAHVFVASPSLPLRYAGARSEDASVEERALLPADEFFFFPANLWPHKNHERLFIAFRDFRARTGSGAELVLTGSPSGWPELRARHSDLPLRHLGFVSPALLKLAYERAAALTFFSLYEGFGIPLLEAFDAGTPVLCSNTTSLPEVAGDAALMCDPMDVEAIARLLEEVSGDGELRTQLVARGKERLGRYSWSRAADELGAALERVSGKARRPTLDAAPVVSLVTPSYNQAPFIRETIESVLAQSYPNIEYLVVDGGSTDGTLDVLSSYGDRIRWISEPDSGQAEAINKGLAMSSGQIVAYLNSDDVLLPRAVEQVVDYFYDHPGCDLVYGDADYIDDAGKVVGTYRTAPYSFERLMEDCCICQPATFWRADAATAVGGFDESLQYALDYDYWIRFDRSGNELQYLPETLAQSRLHPDAKTLRARPEIYREIFQVCLNRGGYVSRSYVDGYWRHLVYERRGAASLLRFAPFLRGVAVRLHHPWVNRRNRIRRRVNVLRFGLHRSLVLLAQRSPRLLRLLLGVRGGGRDMLGVAFGSSRLRVSGFSPDNWVGDRLEVVVEPREQTRRLALSGRPVAEMTVKVSANGAQLGEFPLHGSELEAVTIELPPGPREVVSFAFSAHALDTKGRRVSFLVQETNLFGEEDLYALV